MPHKLLALLRTLSIPPAFRSPMDYAPDGRAWTGPDSDRLREHGRCNALVGETPKTVKGYCYLTGEHEVHRTWSEASGLRTGSIRERLGHV